MKSKIELIAGLMIFAAASISVGILVYSGLRRPRALEVPIPRVVVLQPTQETLEDRVEYIETTKVELKDEAQASKQQESQEKAKEPINPYLKNNCEKVRDILNSFASDRPKADEFGGLVAALADAARIRDKSIIDDEGNDSNFEIPETGIYGNLEDTGKNNYIVSLWFPQSFMSSEPYLNPALFFSFSHDDQRQVTAAGGTGGFAARSDVFPKHFPEGEQNIFGWFFEVRPEVTVFRPNYMRWTRDEKGRISLRGGGVKSPISQDEDALKDPNTMQWGYGDLMPYAAWLRLGSEYFKK